jgi:hypothetical protein
LRATILVAEFSPDPRYELFSKFLMFKIVYVEGDWDSPRTYFFGEKN